MPAVPRIIRTVPRGTIIRPGSGVPVLARLRWVNGQEIEIQALAVAWTSTEVEIGWQTAGVDYRTDWIQADQVRPAPGETDPRTDTDP